MAQGLSNHVKVTNGLKEEHTMYRDQVTQQSKWEFEMAANVGCWNKVENRDTLVNAGGGTEKTQNWGGKSSTTIV